MHYKIKYLDADNKAHYILTEDESALGAMQRVLLEYPGVEVVYLSEMRSVYEVIDTYPNGEVYSAKMYITMAQEDGKKPKRKGYTILTTAGTLKGAIAKFDDLLMQGYDMEVDTYKDTNCTWL